MTNFETEFLRTFYESFINVIHPSELEKALRHFQSAPGEQNYERYSGKYTFGLINWKQHDAEKFTAAFAETLAKTTEKFIDTQDVNMIYNLTEKIRTEYIPAIVKKLDPEKPFLELPNQLKLHLTRLPNKENTSIFNEYSFFGGAAVMVLGAAVIYNNYSPRQ